MDAVVKRIVPPEEFIKAWQTSGTVGDVARKTGLSKSGCHLRYHRYKKVGIKLKEMPKGTHTPALDVKKLNELAASFE